jgi:hypothetical protein
MMDMRKKMMPVMEKRMKEGKPMPMGCPMMQKMMSDKEGMLMMKDKPASP